MGFGILQNASDHLSTFVPTEAFQLDICCLFEHLYFNLTLASGRIKILKTIGSYVRLLFYPEFQFI